MGGLRELPTTARWALGSPEASWEAREAPRRSETSPPEGGGTQRVFEVWVCPSGTPFWGALRRASCLFCGASGPVGPALWGL